MELEKVATDLIARARLDKIIKVSFKQEQSKMKPYWVVDRIWVDLDAWRQMVKGLGWQVHLSNTTTKEYEAKKLVSIYNQQPIEERGFSRLKTRNLQIRPLYLREEQRISGLLWLLSLALKVLTLTEYRLRTALAQRNEQLAGLNPASRTQKTNTPTTERVIAAFSNITLTTIIEENFTHRHVSALNSTQQHILLLLGLPLDLYQGLAHSHLQVEGSN
jgi:transposase